MPRGVKKTKKSTDTENKLHTEVTLSEDGIANVNTNHSSTSMRLHRSQTIGEIKPQKHQVKSKVVVPDQDRQKRKDLRIQGESNTTHTFEFNENGKTIHIEINDGEFASEEELEPNSEQGAIPSESEDEETEYDEASDQEAGEITEEGSELDMERESDHVPEPASPEVNKKKQKQRKRSSVEDRLDTLSNTLLAMKELLTKKGITEPITTDSKELSKKDSTKTGRDKVTDDLLSDTTIYQNALEQIDDSEPLDADPEITFKNKCDQTQVNSKRDSSSSEEKIDTSDELLDVELEINGNLFPDGEPVEKRRKCSLQEGDEASKPELDHAEEMIREVESNKIRMLATPGKNPFLVI